MEDFKSAKTSFFTRPPDAHMFEEDFFNHQIQLFLNKKGLSRNRNFYLRDNRFAK
jgi:hypothetical protein